ncbi:RNA-binding S4 domain-containing protein [Inhella proteolytica]|uniref:RNA-binding S4 domain-containing protein n=1 Tax=Inhella proteolytica TaxID=2795029 RepID=A0A931NII9_9BURK|nr:RNA-binding S4 domain-containing protein [Inhella proteolytica]MBH9579391.1 RNA-binding S4 domain-containing protein [Inhella proteolytica]
MNPDTFPLRGDHITLEALIKAADLNGQRELARAVIADGLVQVNGEVETRRGRKLRSGDVVQLGAAALRVVDGDPEQ